MTPIQYIVQYLREEMTDLEGRVWPFMAPQRNDAWPAVTIQEDQVTPEDTKGWGACMDSHLMQINVFATSYKEAYETAALIRDLLEQEEHFQPEEAPEIAIIQFSGIRDGIFDMDARLYHRILTLNVFVNK